LVTSGASAAEQPDRRASAATRARAPDRRDRDRGAVVIPEMMAATAAIATSASILDTVGFDPRRRHRRSTFDYVFVAASCVVAVGLLIWAVFGA
jgi:hypothetical protein